MPRLCLIDGSGFIFRAYHSLPPLTRSDGLPTGAVYGFVAMLLRLREQLQSEALAVIFDAGRITFRNRLYPEYKAHRPPAPDDLVPQFPLVREATVALGIPAIELADYEADDVIAAYTKAALSAGMEVVIVSSDKDLMQLVGAQVTMFDAMKQKTIDAAAVTEKFGVPPERVRDVLALIGDSSDNIPGVPGIGPKTAAELVQRFGGLEAILAGASDITQRARRDSLLANQDKARLSYLLIGLDDSIALPVPLSDLTRLSRDDEKLVAFLRKMEFKSLAAKFSAGGPAPVAAPLPQHERKYPMVTTQAALAEWVTRAQSATRVSITCYLQDRQPVGLALCVGLHHACYAPLSANAAGVPQADMFGAPAAPIPAVSLSLFEAQATLAPLLNDDAVLKIGHNVKSWWYLLAPSAPGTAPLEDVMLLSYSLGAGKGDHELATLIAAHLQESPPAPPPPLKPRGAAAAQDGEAWRDYAAAEADAVWRLADTLKAALFAAKSLTLYETIERPLIPVIARMEQHGIKIDAEQLGVLSEDFGSRMLVLEEEIYTLAGERFTIGSPKQLGEILFSKLGLATGRKSSKGGGFSTGADVLEELAEEGAKLPARILDWRQLAKLKNTYTDALATCISPVDGRVHTSFAMALTSTGRLSSSNPNLQNIPIRSEEGRKIRRAFVAEEGFHLISADYSQIELRLLADMADIAPLKAAFLAGHDIHAATASQMFGVAQSAVTPELRRQAKTINFGIIYGISAHGLATRLGLSRPEAAEYINAYFRQYPGIREYMERAKEEARRLGYVTTLFGRRAHMPGIKDKNGAVRSFSERAAINAPLQGTAADIIKRAMIAVQRALEGSQGRMLLQVHDELVVEAPIAQAPALALRVQRAMEGAAHLSVPLTAETHIGPHWGKD